MKKRQLITILLLAVIIILIGAIFYIASILSDNSPNSPARVLIKTKAQSKTYSRTIALNTVVSPTPFYTATPIPTEIITPSPTEVILAYNNPPPIGTVSSEIKITSSPVPTKTTSLPATGYLTNVFIIFTIASILIFFAFIF